MVILHMPCLGHNTWKILSFHGHWDIRNLNLSAIIEGKYAVY